MTDKEAPDYKNIIKNPMDLSTLRKRVDSGVVAEVAALVGYPAPSNHRPAPPITSLHPTTSALHPTTTASASASPSPPNPILALSLALNLALSPPPLLPMVGGRPDAHLPERHAVQRQGFRLP